MTSIPYITCKMIANFFPIQLFNSNNLPTLFYHNYRFLFAEGIDIPSSPKRKTI